METPSVEVDQKPVERSKIQRFFLNFGKLILDATKLSFGSLVLGTIIKGDFPQSTLLVAGIIASGVGAIIGLILTTIYEEK
jgi:hypothetical protein